MRHLTNTWIIMMLLFFVQYPQLTCASQSTLISPSISNREIEVFFAPDDQPTKRLLSEISKAKTKIYAAVYMITDKRIAKELAVAKKRGVDVQIITDKASADSPFGKVHFLQQNNIKVHVFSPNSKPTTVGKKIKRTIIPLDPDKQKVEDAKQEQIRLELRMGTASLHQNATEQVVKYSKRGAKRGSHTAL